MLELRLSFDNENDWLWTTGDRHVAVPSNMLLCTAADRGLVHMVRQLLAHPKIDPSFHHNQPLVYAVGSHRTEVVELLLADPRVDPNDRNGYILYLAIQSRYYDVALLLFSDARTDPSTDNQGAIFWAADYDIPEVVKVLLEDPRVVAIGAIEHANGTSLRILAAHDTWGISNYRAAFEQYHPEIVEEYDFVLSQGVTMGWVAKQLPTWSDLVLPVSDRLKASFIF